MRSLFAAIAAMIALALTSPAFGHHNRWAFGSSAPLQYKTMLENLNRYSPLKVHVQCHGAGRVRLQGGGRGWVHIVCFTSLGRTIIFHHTARGKIIRTVR
jgi:hypothetical protein